MDQEIQSCPFLGDRIEYGLHRTIRFDIERQVEGRLYVARDRVDVRLRLVVEVGDSKHGTSLVKGLCTASRDRMLVGNADDEANLSIQLDRQDRARGYSANT